MMSRGGNVSWGSLGRKMLPLQLRNEGSGDETTEEALETMGATRAGSRHM